MMDTAAKQPRYYLCTMSCFGCRYIYILRWDAITSRGNEAVELRDAVINRLASRDHGTAAGEGQDRSRGLVPTAMPVHHPSRG